MLHEEVEKPTPPTSTAPKPARLIGSLRSIFDKLPSYIPTLDLVKKRKNEKRIGKIPKRFKVYEAVPSTTITTKWKIMSYFILFAKDSRKITLRQFDFLKNVQ